MAILILNRKQIRKNAGLYNLHSKNNLVELKNILKDLTLKEVPDDQRPAEWSYPKQTANASTQTTGGNVWAYSRSKKNKVKTFAL